MTLNKSAYRVGDPELCSVLGIGRSRIFEEIRLGRLKAKKAGKCTLITPDAIRAWFDVLPDALESREAADAA